MRGTIKPLFNHIASHFAVASYFEQGGRCKNEKHPGVTLK
jgi:hypothetical protein